ncbi:PAS domain S-box protein [Halomicroarcula limicola]|uniref:histidine kinase n=1 Tax=Haloarcula limicola TaxID=1429915 RepID=A0A8J7YD96_9EURY|nr:PAS domain S-box protein [Halomicroarcula limicola]MBV0925789.1 PAS domain S-box protein [Halomicroarcula limicola]
MRPLSQLLSRVGGRRLISVLGGLYLALAVGFPATLLTGGRTVGDISLASLLVGGSGLVLLYSSYRIPQTRVRPELYDVVAGWCVRAIGVMVGILLLAALFGTLDDPLSGVPILSSLASVAGLGVGYQDAKARTRALDAEEQQRAAERYSRELERYKTIVETVNDGIFVADAADRFTLVNDAYTRLVGYDRETLVGADTALVAAEGTDVEGIRRTVEREVGSGDGKSKTYASQISTASGETIDAEMTVAPLPSQADAAPDKVVVVRDVTERNERERRLEAQNERLDSFAGMLAHELRNPVNIGQIYSAQLPAEPNPDAVGYVADAFDRIEDIIDVMLVITGERDVVPSSGPVQLAAVALEAWEEVDAPGATLELELDFAAAVDETYTRHLFRNLFENAIEHGGSDVTLTVGELPTGFYVADDGIGISESTRREIFQSGYTTAGDQGGMGLGLAFVRQLTDVYGWTCSVTESESGGARFEFENVTDGVA